MLRFNFLFILVLVYFPSIRQVDAVCDSEYPNSLPNGTCVFISTDVTSYCDAQVSQKERNWFWLSESFFFYFVEILSTEERWWIVDEWTKTWRIFYDDENNKDDEYNIISQQRFLDRFNHFISTNRLRLNYFEKRQNTTFSMDRQH